MKACCKPEMDLSEMSMNIQQTNENEIHLEEVEEVE